MTTDRQKRQDRRARRAARAVERIAPAPPAPANRATFRVSHAQAVAARELPSILYRKGKGSFAIAPGRDKPARTIEDAPPPPRPPKLHRSPSRERAHREAERLTMDQPDPRLKCRPKDTTPKGGKGSGRSFIPWGDC